MAVFRFIRRILFNNKPALSAVCDGAGTSTCRGVQSSPHGCKTPRIASRSLFKTPSLKATPHLASYVIFFVFQRRKKPCDTSCMSGGANWNYLGWSNLYQWWHSDNSDVHFSGQHRHRRFCEWVFLILRILSLNPLSVLHVRRCHIHLQLQSTTIRLFLLGSQQNLVQGSHVSLSFHFRYFSSQSEPYLKKRTLCCFAQTPAAGF